MPRMEELSQKYMIISTTVSDSSNWSKLLLSYKIMRIVAWSGEKREEKMAFGWGFKANNDASKQTFIWRFWWFGPNK